MILPEVAGLTSEQRTHYERCRAAGTSHSLAVILASRSAPRAVRADERWRGAEDARRMGVRGARGKYQAGLARYPGDPEAFVQSRADARRVADKRGLAIHHGPANSGGANQRRSQKEPRPNG